MFYNPKLVNQYLDSLNEEIKTKYNNEELSTIYIGGGTPSCLAISQLKYLFKILEIFQKKPDCEITFECNVNDIDIELLEILRVNGVNRLSIGIQSFDSKNLELLNRHHTFADVEKKITMCKNMGFFNINIDLIYALPEQNLTTLKKDLNLFLKLDVPHISTYSLMIEENTLLKIKNTQPIDEQLDYKMYETIRKKLKNNGYIHYEVSNFAKAGFESKHNLTYWNNDYYYGFGLAACGYTHGMRYENTKNLTKYLKHDYIKEENILSKQEEMDNELMLGLRKIKGINLEHFFNKFDINISEVYNLQPLLKSKDLIYKNGYIFINPDKIYIMNEILIKLI